MRLFSSFLLSVLFLLVFRSGFVFALEENCLVGIQGYDPVSYFQKSGPRHGDGNHQAFYEGVGYIFVSEANKKIFKENPVKYLPAYGGYCAFGISAGKKVYGDPLTWKIVNNKLYFNLNKKIQTIWLKDIALYVGQADKEWRKIRDVSAEKL